MENEVISATKFKAECLQIMEEVKKTRRKVTITKRNIPIAELTPIKKDKNPIYGLLKGVGETTGDIIEPIDEEWDVNS
tara:strand:+ start:372 stop:605 length:234 start_codon:yes stop_codon:yes gene_type:complete